MTGDAVQQLGNALARCVLIAAAGLQGPHRRVDDFLWPVKVGPALAEIDRSVPERQVVYLGKDGRAESGDAIGVGRHGCSVNKASGGRSIAGGARYVSASRAALARRSTR